MVGSISFWGSNIAFAKLQDLIPTRPLAVPGQQVINVVLLLGIVAACVDIAANNGDPSQGLFIAILIAAAILGNMVVLPIGGADMPVVISLLNAFTGLSAAAAGFALDNVALIVAGTLVGSSGTILTMEMATAMNRSVGNVLFAGFGGAPAGGGGGTARNARTLRSAPRTRRSSSPTRIRSRSSPATASRSPRPSTRSRRSPTSWRSAASPSTTRSIPSPAACPAT